MRGDKFLTIFTPTYNRKKFLERLYNSLKRQEDKDFLWLVVDDGSTDGTGEYIKHLQSETKDFEIEYIYKSNGGLYTGWNTAIQNCHTEFCMCCDSDDWLDDRCIKEIKNIWKQNKREDCAGIVGLDFFSDERIIGWKLPDKKYFDLNELYINGKLRGDKKLVTRTELYRPYVPLEPGKKGEKNFNPNYLNHLISETYCWMALNKNLVYMEYQPDGMSHRIYNQYADSPNSFIKLRRLYVSLKKATFLFKCRHMIHYDAECLLAHKGKDVFNHNSPERWMGIILFPFGILYYFWILFKIKK